MSASLDPVIHAPNRLQMCCMLAAVDTIDFATVREALDVSESVLSKHVKTLEESGYVKVRKAASEGRQRTSCRCPGPAARRCGATSQR